MNCRSKIQSNISLSGKIIRQEYRKNDNTLQKWFKTNSTLSVNKEIATNDLIQEINDISSDNKIIPNSLQLKKQALIDLIVFLNVILRDQCIHGGKKEDEININIKSIESCLTSINAIAPIDAKKLSTFAENILIICTHNHETMTKITTCTGSSKKVLNILKGKNDKIEGTFDMSHVKNMLCSKSIIPNTLGIYIDSNENSNLNIIYNTFLKNDKAKSENNTIAKQQKTITYNEGYFVSDDKINFKGINFKGKIYELSQHKYSMYKLYYIKNNMTKLKILHNEIFIKAKLFEFKYSDNITGHLKNKYHLLIRKEKQIQDYDIYEHVEEYTHPDSNSDKHEERCVHERDACK